MIDKAELITKVTTRFRSLANYLEADDYDQAASDMLNETGFVFPITDPTAAFWATERTHRHLLFYLYTESARKFQIKGIALNQRFDHYGQMVAMMDKRWDEFLANNPDLLLTGSESWEMFSHQLSSTWKHDEIGRELFIENADIYPKKTT